MGPVLLVLLGVACAYIGHWLPLWQDSIYPPEVDTRIGFIVAGFAPTTTGSAILAIYSSIRLFRVQRQSPTIVGRVLLLVLVLPSGTSQTFLS